MASVFTCRTIKQLCLAGLCPALLGTTHPDSGFEARLLASHNLERAALGLAPLRWDPDLAAGAAQWAQHLADTKQFKHSPNSVDPAGENLWAGTTGRFTPERMVGLWLAEKRHFKAGVFPANSSTGNSQDVSHYTQVIWRYSNRVGCSLAQGETEDVLVCRYKTPGNVWGQSPL
jgi:hypothetical protein